MTKEEFLEMVKEHLVLDVYVSKNWDNVNIQVMLRDSETYEVLTSASDDFDLGFNK